MGNIKIFIENIKKAVYGKDVRQSIINAIEQTYDDAIANGHVDMEVSKARGSYSSLNDRLEAINDTIETADSDLKNQITNGLSKISSGTPLVASSINEMTDITRIYVNITDGHWYYHNGTQWSDGGIYQAVENSDEVLKLSSIVDVLDNDSYKHIKIDYAIFSGTLNSTGEESSNTSYMNKHCRTRFLKVKKGDKLSISNYIVNVYYFDNNKTYLSNTVYNTETEIEFYEDGFIRLKIYKSDETNINTNTTLGSEISLEERQTIYKSIILYFKNKLDIIKNDKYNGSFRAGTYQTRNTNYSYGYYSDSLSKYLVTDIMYLSKNTIVNSRNKYLIIYNNDTFEVINPIFNYMNKITEDGNYTIIVRNVDESVLDEHEEINININQNYINDMIQRKTNLVYHRGFSSMRAENTLQAYNYCNEYGCKWVECDVRQTSDDELVLMHDSTLDRTTNGTGSLSDHTLEQIKSLYIRGSMYVDKYQQKLRVPTLEEFLICCCNNNLKPFIEIKEAINYQKLIDLIIKYGFEKNCCVFSYNYNYLEAIRKLNKKIYIAFISDNYNSESVQNYEKLGINSGLMININNFDNSAVDTIHNLDGFIGCFVSDDYTEYQNKKDLNIDFFITNRILDSEYIPFKIENLFYSSTGNTNISKEIAESEINIFSDVLEVQVDVYYEDSANAPTLTIGEKTLKATKVNEWNTLKMQFIKKESGNVKITLISEDTDFRYVDFKVKKYINHS